MRLVVIVALFVTAFGGLAYSAPVVEQPYSVTPDNRLITQVMINGMGPYNMILDTGCSRTTLLAHTARALGIAPTSDDKIGVYSIAAEASSHPFFLHELKLSDEAITNLTVVVLDDPADDIGVPDGIIGIDILERYAVVFDAVSRRLRLFPRAEGVPLPYSRWHYTTMAPKPLRAANANFWFIDATYADVRAKTLLDLGMGATLVTWNLAEEILPRAVMPRKGDEKVRDALGKGLSAFHIEDLPIKIAGHNWPKSTVLVADAPVFIKLEIAGQSIGVIGAGLLARTSFALDFENHRLYVAQRS